MDIFVTDHAGERIKERLGIKAKGHVKVATEAWDSGLWIESTAGNLKRYLLDYTKPREDGTTAAIRLHKLHIWVFIGRRLITVLNLPSHLHRSAIDATARVDRTKETPGPE